MEKGSDLMKRMTSLLTIMLLTVSLSLSFGQSIDKSLPAATSQFYVNDFANVLTPETEVTMLGAAEELYKQTKAQVVVVTVPSLDGAALEDYSLALYRKWGIGDKKLNNGVLLLVSTGDRKSRIEVGYGLEGVLNDAKTGRIQDEYMISYLKENDYDKGLMGGFTNIVEEVYKEYNLAVPSNVNANLYYNPVVDNNSGGGEGVNPIFIVIAVILIMIDLIFNRGRIVFMLLYIFSRSGGRGGGGGFGGGGNSGGGGSAGGGGSSRSF